MLPMNWPEDTQALVTFDKQGGGMVYDKQGGEFEYGSREQLEAWLCLNVPIRQGDE